jgi:AraC-like DNA-binding protein
MFLDSAYNSVSKTTKVYYETKSDLVNASFDMERLKEKERKQRNIYLTVILGLILLISFTLIIYSQQQSKNRVLKALVKKNLQIIEDERKRNQSIANNKTKKAGRAISTYEKSDLLYSNLLTWLEKDKQFKRKDLNIELIAKELNTNREYLSRSINEQNIRFNDLINKYRVEEAMQIFSDHSNKLNRYNLSVIASEVGFNSNSVFIEAFRKHTGMNPTQFRENANSTEP